MPKRGVLWVLLVLVTIISLEVVLVAQETAAPDEETPSAQMAASDVDAGGQDALSGSVDWEEALFVLLIVVIVMMGLIGFEWMSRRKRSFH